MKLKPLLLVLPAAAVLVGCASVKSTMNATQSDGGLVYYMPKRDIVITITNTGGEIASAVPTPSTPYADRSRPYLLEYQRHPLAKNTLDVDVSEAGLLTSSKANQTGDAVAALAGLGTLAGYIGGGGFSLQADAPAAAKALLAGTPCSREGAHTFIVPAATSNGQVCGGKIDYQIEPLGGDKAPDVAMTQTAGDAAAGVFYRVNRPYKVRLSSATFNSETIVFSPSESQTFFLPVARTFFSNNDAKITLSNGAGVPSKYAQDTEGEVAALLKLPAALVTPYFAAIGQVFAGVSSNKTAEAAALNGSVSLELTKQKYAACIKAIEDKDTSQIAALKCAGN